MSFKIVAGDFPKNTRYSFQSLSWGFGGDSICLTNQIANLELMTEENKKKILGSAGWGITGAVLGGLFAAPVALAAGLAGILKGGNKKEICFACHLKDGRKFMAISDNKTFQDFLALSFNSK